MTKMMTSCMEAAGIIGVEALPMPNDMRYVVGRYVIESGILCFSKVGSKVGGFTEDLTQLCNLTILSRSSRHAM